MSVYKLTYFDLTALGEPIRFILSYSGIDFEDNRIARDDWPKLKPTTPLGQLPVLEIDGQTFYQSNAIARYLAKKLNLNGSNDYEAFEVDATLETIADMRQTLARWFFEPDADKKAATKVENFEKAGFFLNKLDTAAKKNGGFLVGGKLTVADLVFAGLSYFFFHIAGDDFLKSYPNLKNIVEKVVSQPGIKSYIAKRPKGDF